MQRRRRQVTALQVIVYSLAAAFCGGDHVSDPPQKQPPPAVAAITVEMGADQRGVVGAPLPIEVAVKVADASGRGLAGVQVSFSPDSTGGSVAAASVTTDSDGLARTTWTLGKKAGSVHLTARAGGVSVVASAVAIAGPPALMLSASSIQPAILFADGLDSLRVQLFDAFNNPVSGAEVMWSGPPGTTLSPFTFSRSDGSSAVAVKLNDVAGPITISASANAGKAKASFVTTVVHPNLAANGHVIGTILVGSRARFYNRYTGRTFVPRGSLYTVISNMSRPFGGPIQSHATFNVGSYDPSAAETALARMEELQYNTVRVFLTACCSGGMMDNGVLSSAYFANVADFLRRAQAHHIVTYLSLDFLPDQGRYGQILAAATADQQYPNVYYLSSAGISVAQMIWTDIITALRSQGAPTDWIFGYELQNEVYYDTSVMPLSRNSGTLTAPNGGVYSLADPNERRRLMEDGMVYFVDRGRESIRSQDPTALVTVSSFVENEPNLSRPATDTRVSVSNALTRSSADFLDFHAYPRAEKLTIEQMAQNYRLPTAALSKPVLMGEFGAHKQFGFTSAAASADELINWQVTSCSLGWSGWLFFTWGADVPSFPHWTLSDEGGTLATALSPRQRFDPCKR